MIESWRLIATSLAEPFDNTSLSAGEYGSPGHSSSCILLFQDSVAGALRGSCGDNAPQPRLRNSIPNQIELTFYD